MSESKSIGTRVGPGSNFADPAVALPTRGEPLSPTSANHTNQTNHTNRTKDTIERVSSVDDHIKQQVDRVIREIRQDLRKGTAEIRVWSSVYFPSDSVAPGFHAATSRPTGGVRLSDIDLTDRIIAELERDCALHIDTSPSIDNLVNVAAGNFASTVLRVSERAPGDERPNRYGHRAAADWAGGAAQIRRGLHELGAEIALGPKVWQPTFWKELFTHLGKM